MVRVFELLLLAERAAGFGAGREAAGLGRAGVADFLVVAALGRAAVERVLLGLGALDFVAAGRGLAAVLVVRVAVLVVGLVADSSDTGGLSFAPVNRFNSRNKY